MPRPNWFFGFPLDGTFLLGLPPVPPRFRRFHPADVHLTLAFLGGCKEESALRALAALDARLSATAIAALEVSLGEIVPMGGSRRRYTALSALLTLGREEAARAITSLRDDLTGAATGRRETRPAKPHVTLARPPRRASDADREAGLTWAAGIDLSGVSALLDRVALFTWNDNRRERLFRVVAERRLR